MEYNKKEYLINIQLNFSILNTKNHDFLISKYLKKGEIINFNLLIHLFSAIRLSKFKIINIKGNWNIKGDQIDIINI